jgi:hypothetical protein
MRSGKRRLTRPLVRKDRIALFERTLHPTQDHPWPFTDRQLATLRARLGEIDCPRRIEAEAMIVPLARQFLARVEGQRPFNNKRVEPRAELARLVQAIDGLWEAFQGLSLPTRQLLGKNRVLLAILSRCAPCARKQPPRPHCLPCRCTAAPPSRRRSDEPWCSTSPAPSTTPTTARSDRAGASTSRSRTFSRDCRRRTG